MAARRPLAVLGVLAALADILAQSMAAWRGCEDRMAR